MKNKTTYHFDYGGIGKYMKRYIDSLKDLKNKKIADVPCGDGRTCYLLQQKGAQTVGLDLYPEFYKLKTGEVKFSDLSDILDAKDESFDMLICQEGIEHLPNQLFAMKEFNRVLKPNGKLLITTPSMSHIRSKLSNFFLESDALTRLAPSELDSIWFSDTKKDDLYYGHLFLIGVQQMQSLAHLTGFMVKKRLWTSIGPTSSFLLVFTYPFFIFFNIYCFIHYIRKNKHIPFKQRLQKYLQRIALNLSIKTLICKHIFWVFEKKHTLKETCEKLKKLHRK